MASDASSGGTGTDPGVRLLARIGDFVGPLVRLDRSHIQMEDSHHETVTVAIRQAYKVSFDTVSSGGVGGVPAGTIEAPDANAAQREVAAQLAAARSAIGSRLAEWAAAHGNTPLARPAIRDVFTASPSVGHIEICPACHGEGKRPCATCSSSGVVACKQCDARGGTPCKTCETSGSVRCQRCYGLGYQLRDRQDGEQERISCTGCGGRGANTCGSCHGRGSIVCPACHGQKKVACPQCQGAGTQTCDACEGQGKRHHVTRVIGAVSETLVLRPGLADPGITARLATLKTAEQIIDLCEDSRVTTETTATSLTRDTLACIPVTTATVKVGGHRIVLRGYGPRQLVHDYGNIGGLLLDADISRLAAALPEKRQRPPRASEEADRALADVLASPVNAAIAENAAGGDLDGIERRYSGIVSTDYVKRAAPITRRALSHIYWADMLRRPALVVLALPLLQLPIGILTRNLDGGARTMAMLGVMLVAFAAAIAAHIFVAQKLQKRLRPDGAPRLAFLLDRLKLTRNWLLAAAAAAIVFTLVVAWLTGLVFSPPPQPDP